jgi:hypothetical protein
MAIKKTKAIMVMLDALLDTRLGTIAKIDGSKLPEILSSDTYHIRDCDEFTGIDRDVFLKTYADRDIDTLSNSMLTNMVPLLKHFVGVIKNDINKTPFETETDIEVNYYPYKLSVEEVSLIKLAIKSKVNNIANVEMISMSPTDLTPIHCKANYAVMVMYTYNEWLIANKDLFESCLMPEVALFVPAIYFEPRPSDENIEAISKEIMPPMQALELLVSVFVNLQLIDVKYFSIINTADEVIKT